jgi:hypothetical protein
METALNSLTRRLTRVLMKNDWLWELVQRITGNDFFYRQRYPVIHKRARRQAAPLLERLEVLQGPFSGMKYARELSVGSSLWPKLLGTYESELRPAFDWIARRGNYRNIIDVGFAEGYYLIGFGRWFANSQLVGFDSDPAASEQCRANALANGIDPGRLRLFGTFDSEQMANQLKPNSLAIVDCEGFENQVIAGLTVEQASCADWLIETHDHLVPGTSERIKRTLGKTHDLLELSADSDVRSKCRSLPLAIRETCDPYAQEALVSEGRVARQSWIFATRRTA